VSRRQAATLLNQAGHEACRARPQETAPEERPFTPPHIGVSWAEGRRG